MQNSFYKSKFSAFFSVRNRLERRAGKFNLQKIRAKTSPCNAILPLKNSKNVSKYFQLKWPFKDFCKSTDRVNIMNPNSKVPNNTEVTRFSTALFYLIQTISPVNSATFYNFKAKICQLWTPQSTFDNVDFCQIWAKWPKRNPISLGI